jgi:hypothetical protein
VIKLNYSLLASSFEHTLRWPHPHVAKATLRFGRLDCIQNSFRQNLHTILITYLDELPAFKGKLTTTEFLAKYIHDGIKEGVKEAFEGRIKVVLGESHIAWAGYEGE